MKIIGRVDKADFPELGLEELSIKVDTGAYTSSIHCHHIQEVIIDETKFIEFQLLDPSHPKFDNKLFKTKNYEEVTVKSSFGDVEQRFVIYTTIFIFDQAYPIVLSLSERNDMRYPILLGRKFLNKQFIVDTSKKNVSFKLKQQRKEN